MVTSNYKKVSEILVLQILFHIFHIDILGGRLKVRIAGNYQRPHVIDLRCPEMQVEWITPNPISVTINGFAIDISNRAFDGKRIIRGITLTLSTPVRTL